jgi:hypothetical protein
MRLWGKGEGGEAADDAESGQAHLDLALVRVPVLVQVQAAVSRRHGAHVAVLGQVVHAPQGAAFSHLAIRAGKALRG